MQREWKHQFRMTCHRQELHLHHTGNNMILFCRDNANNDSTCCGDTRFNTREPQTRCPKAGTLNLCRRVKKRKKTMISIQLFIMIVQYNDQWPNDKRQWITRIHILALVYCNHSNDSISDLCLSVLCHTCLQTDCMFPTESDRHLDSYIVIIDSLHWLIVCSVCGIVYVQTM